MIADLLVEALILALRAARSARRAVCGVLRAARLDWYARHP